MTTTRMRVIFSVIVLIGLFIAVFLYQARTNREAVVENLPSEQQPVTNTEESPTPRVMSNVVGTVQSVSPDMLTITMQKFAGGTAEGQVSERKVLVNATTKIFRIRAEEASSPEVTTNIIRPQMGTSTGASVTPPAPLTRIEIDLADVKVGNMVSVVVERDMLKEESLVAEMIEILPPVTTRVDASKATTTSL